MEKIDGKWIEARLQGNRGERARLAEAMGIGPDMVAKIMSGKRQVKPEEVPRVLEFFGLHLEIVTQQERGWLKAYREASAERLAAVEAVLAYQPRQKDTP